MESIKSFASSPNVHIVLLPSLAGRRAGEVHGEVPEDGGHPLERPQEPAEQHVGVEAAHARLHRRRQLVEDGRQEEP